MKAGNHMNNEVITQIKDRKSTRAFEEKPITKEVKDLIIEAAFQAPSAGNQQLYTILDITDQQLLNTVSFLCDNQPFIQTSNMCLIFLADCRRYMNVYHAADIDCRKPGIGDLLLSIADACIAAQNAVVCAESLGVGSCYIGDVIENAEKMKEALHLPEYVVPACMLVFGYPKKEAQNRIKPNRFYHEALVFNNYYEDRSKEEIIHDFTLRANKEDYDFKKDITAFCQRKYESDFSKEMSRSADIYISSFQK